MFAPGSAYAYRNSNYFVLGSVIETVSSSKYPDYLALHLSAGALWSNVGDLATWDAALLNGKVIPASLFTLMVTPTLVPSYPQGGPSDCAMGWVSGTEMGHPFVWHGETASYTAFNGMFLDDGFSVTLLTNGRVSEDTPLMNLGEQIIQAICTSSDAAGTC